MLIPKELDVTDAHLVDLLAIFTRWCATPVQALLLEIPNGEAKNLAASNRLRGFFASLRMTSVVGWF
jgi:hypothetical protein